MIAKNIHKRVHSILLKSRTFLRDKEKKPLFQILLELIETAIVYRCIPLHYFASFLYRKTVNNHLDYLCARETLQIHRAFHRRDTLDILDNKLLFHEHFSNKGISIPMRLGYNLKTMWFSDVSSGMRDAELQSANEFATLVKNLFQYLDCASIFAKPLRGSVGRGIVKINKNILEPVSAADFSHLFKLITGDCFIFQKQIIQHPELNRIYNSSLNTIRIDTFLDKNNKPEVISAFLRTGVAGRVVDNLGAGGIFIGIDLSSGKLKNIGRTKMEMGGMVYSKHPDSGVVFEDLTIPFMAEVKALACQAARLLPERLVGWDIAITGDGPVLIEGNGWYELIYGQIAYGGYRRHPVFKNVMQAAALKVTN